MDSSTTNYTLMAKQGPIEGGSTWIDISPELFSGVVLLPVAIVTSVLTILGILTISCFRKNMTVLTVLAAGTFGSVLINAQYIEKQLAVTYIIQQSDSISSVGFFGWPADGCSGVLSAILLSVFYFVSKNRRKGKNVCTAAPTKPW